MKKQLRPGFLFRVRKYKNPPSDWGNSMERVMGKICQVKEASVKQHDGTKEFTISYHYLNFSNEPSDNNYYFGNYFLLNEILKVNTIQEDI
jgi:hypothetical protein